MALQYIYPQILGSLCDYVTYVVCLRVSLIMEIALVIDCHLLENEFGENDQES